MARINRSESFDPRVRGTYHVVSRCVRGAWMLSSENVDRRDDLLRLLEELAAIYAIAIVAAAFLSNHFHLILINLPELVDRWSDREVILRAQRAYPTRFARMGVHGPPNDDQMKVLLRDTKLIREMRRRLSDISWMMRLLKQRFAAQVNRQEQKTGHFWEGRFKMVEILSEQQLITTMIYVAVNQIRAGQATSLDTSFWTSVCWQLQAREKRLAGDAEGAAARDGLLTPLSTTDDAAQLGSQDGTAGSRRARDTGTLEMSLDEFVRLAEFAAKLPHRKRPRAPAKLAPLLERIGVTVSALQLALDGVI